LCLTVTYNFSEIRGRTLPSYIEAQKRPQVVSVRTHMVRSTRNSSRYNGCGVLSKTHSFAVKQIKVDHNV